jgi:SAM-dependent methyltransferase
MSWTEYWNEESTIYVNARHKRVHYEAVARDLLACLPASAARVVDYGCGDALSAHVVADACAHLYLCDSAPRVRDGLAERCRGRPDISIISPCEFEDLADRTIDLIVVNSVVQYLSVDEFARLLAVARDKLAPAGSLVLADIVPRHVGPLRDAAEFLRFARANGFLAPAAAGLVKSFFSSYGHTRARLGLLRFDEAELLHLLAASGFRARRRYPNVGHNAERMTVVAQVRDVAGAVPARTRHVGAAGMALDAAPPAMAAERSAQSGASVSLPQLPLALPNSPSRSA